MKNLSNNSEYIQVIFKLAEDYEKYSSNSKSIPDKLIYKVATQKSYDNAEINARIATFEKLDKPIIKKAFDTRRINQETDRNPRENLQYWQRADQYIDDEMQSKIDIFAKLKKPLDELKQSFGTSPEWHNSYSRVLYDSLYRILRIKEADLDIFGPQITYLEQLMFNRYRLSMEELSTISNKDFKNVLLKKDESLLKRGAYLQDTTSTEKSASSGNIIKDTNNNSNMQQNIVDAIFGNNGFRREGERNCERTITITIRDTVVDE